MKIKKITSIISLAIITPAVPLFATFNNDKTGKLSDSKRTYNRNYGLVNNSLEINKQDINPSEDLYGGSYDELYDFENNDYYQGFITFNGDFRVYDNNNILKLIKKQPVVVNASISKAIQGYYLVEIVFKKGSDDYNKFERFLKTNNLVGDFYIIDVEPEYKPNVILRDIPFSPFNEISGGTTKYLDRYQPNFESNNYDKIERINAINETSQLLSSNNKRVGVAVLEIGEGFLQAQALIDAGNTYYFNKDITRVYNRWDPFWHGLIWRPNYGGHATAVASIISGVNGVNPYHDLYGIKYNQPFLNDLNLFGLALSGLDNEISYIKKLDNVKIVNNSWGHFQENKVINAVTKQWYNYNFYSRYMDLITANEPELIYVFSAGNNGNNPIESARKLSWSNLSYNSITVGSNDSNGRLSSFSSRGTNTYGGPLILANGENYATQDDKYRYGTSFSAPFISGVIANTLLKYKDKYKLGINSIIAKAILGVSSLNEANDKTSKQEGINKNYGVGILDYKKIHSAFNNLKYIKWTDNKYISVNNGWHSKDSSDNLSLGRIYLNKNDVLRVDLSWLFKPKNSFALNIQKYTNNYYDSIDYISQDYDLILRDMNGNDIASSRTLNNFEFIRYQIKNSGYYQIIISKGSKTSKSVNNDLAVSWTIDNK